ncbi:uncharacterized protein BDZ99DRAFT_209041 [Mytilinidion resinicola]|uniref:Tho complex subunit 7 n=1 Tax=Mytilinidion resinicola TaxID=574789 RepID=A0A6A6XZY4_9PEZI|nr:uncharacterized protein BDZ99DRAFT_209041 [Mytilinidion resinicola]KAF2802082.1 hypothetical protein BDZ99DRAFT_209041 [Mytilinidion resinicola]
MAPYDYGYLPQAEEDSIHNVARLLSVEARPFQRLTSRLLKPDSLINSPPTLLPTPPPDASAADEAAAAVEVEREKQAARRKLWEEEMLFDFSAFESSIVRMQLIHNSNQTERERYAKEKTRILDTAQAIRDNTVELRVQLEEARKTLALRKTYDELADKITIKEKLKPREDQHAALEKLSNEIEELQEEGREYSVSRDRKREQFGRIMEESRLMLKLIKDEKDEAERKEGVGDSDDVDDGEGSIIRSAVGTPRPDTGGVTPMHGTQEGERGDMLAVPRTRLAPLSQGSSRAPSPSRSQQDTEMAESGRTSGDTRVSDESEMEEGEEEEDAGPVDQMDIS